MCLITTNEGRVKRDYDEPPRHVSNYTAGASPRYSQTASLPRASRDSYRRPSEGYRSSQPNVYRSSQGNVGNVYRSSQPSVRYEYRAAQPVVREVREVVRTAQPVEREVVRYLER